MAHWLLDCQTLCGRPWRLGVGDDAAALVFTHLILVDDPVQRAAVAEPVPKHLRRNPGERQRVVHPQARSILAQLHLLDAEVANLK